MELWAGGEKGPPGEKNGMRNTLLALALAAATMPLTFGHPAPQNPPATPASKTMKTKKAKKAKVKKPKVKKSKAGSTSGN